VTLEISGLAAGTYAVTPYNTWSGEFLAPLEVTCGGSGSCAVPLPDFQSDMAFRLVRK
jgi:hypothetical protein